MRIGDDGIIGVIFGIHEKHDAEAIIREINELSKESGNARVSMDLRKAEGVTW